MTDKRSGQQIRSGASEAIKVSDDLQNRAWLMRAATYASVSVATVLILAKIGAWLVTDSISLLSTLIDSFLDVAASLINLFAVHHSLQPADEEHRFGHGKAEPLAGLAQAAFISGSAVFLVIQAGERLFNPKALTQPDIGIAVMVFSIVLTLGLVMFQKYVVRRTGSLAISADSLHYQTDLLVNVGVIASLLLAAGLGWGWADPVFAVFIAAYIVIGAWKIGLGSLDQLMDREMPAADRQKIVRIALEQTGVISVHDLRTRVSGNRSFIQFHVDLEQSISLQQAHDISDQVMEMVEAAFINAEVLIHQDPVSSPMAGRPE